MKAFLDDPKVKQKYVWRIKAHQKADQLIKGDYWTDGRGCAVGCTIHGSNHKAYEEELGIPEQLAFLEDGIFENLPMEDAKKWPLQFLQAIRTGADLRLVHNRFLAWLLSEETGILTFTDQNRSAILVVRDLHQRSSTGEVIDDATWSAAGSATGLAAGSAAGWAVWAAVRAAESAAESVMWAVIWASASASGSALASRARATYKKMSIKLLELLSAA